MSPMSPMSMTSMRSAFVQTLWADVIAYTLRDAGVGLCVISPGSRSTPLVAALDRTRDERLELVTIIDERAAAFYALGAARATGRPVALVCTSGSAAAHYLPAIVEAAHAGVPLIAITANRPPELHDCGASQTIDQHAIYGGFVRGAFELGAPIGEPAALRAVRRKLVQAVTLALGPDPGPVHVDAAFRKPLEPVVASTSEETDLAKVVHELCAARPLVAPPRLAPSPSAIATLARAIAAEPRGVIVAGAMPVTFGRTREAVFELARRAGYPIVAEAGSQLRFGPRPDDVVLVDHFDLIANAPRPSLILQLGAEPVAASWPTFVACAPRATRWVLAGSQWNDPESAGEVILGEVPHAIDAIGHAVAALLAEPHVGTTGEAISQTTRFANRELANDAARHAGRASSRRRIERAAASISWLGEWNDADRNVAFALDAAIDAHGDSEVAALRATLAALPPAAQLQVGNSLPIRVIDHASARATRHHMFVGGSEAIAGSDGTSATTRPVITQRGAAGIDGLVASAAGATHAGPVLVVLGDVSFAHDLGGLLAARAAVAPLAILVVDNDGGQIFGGLPVSSATSPEALERHWLTPPAVDIPAIAAALGARAVLATSPAAVAHAVARATTSPAVTVIHAPVSATGARDVRRAVLSIAERAESASSPTPIVPTPIVPTPAVPPPITPAGASPADTSSTPAEPARQATPASSFSTYELHARERHLDEFRDAVVAAWRAATPRPL